MKFLFFGGVKKDSRGRFTDISSFINTGRHEKLKILHEAARLARQEQDTITQKSKEFVR